MRPCFHYNRAGYCYRRHACCDSSLLRSCSSPPRWCGLAPWFPLLRDVVCGLAPCCGLAFHPPHNEGAARLVRSHARGSFGVIVRRRVASPHCRGLSSSATDHDCLSRITHCYTSESHSIVHELRRLVRPPPGNIQPRKIAPAPVTDEHCAGERTDAVSQAVRIMMISEVLYRTKLCRHYLSVLSSVYYVLRAANHYFLGSHKLLTWEFPSFAHPAYASESAPHRTRDLCSPLAMRLFIGTATTFVQVGGNSLAVATVAELMPSRVATSSSRILPGPRG